jgi:hypothetical protein
MRTYNVTSRMTPSLGSSSRVEPRVKSESRLTLIWNQVWQRLVNGILHPSELQVWQEFDRHGETQWHSYDPINGRSFVGSEAEMRRWIESRYYA